MNRMLLTTAALAAVLAGPARATIVEPLPNQALQCGENGNAGHARMADAAALRPAAAFTLEAWVCLSPAQPLSPYPIVLSKPAGTLMNGDCSYGFIVERSTGHVIFRVTTSAGTFNATYTGNLLDGQWHHLAGIRKTGSGAVLELIIDGTPLASIPITGAALFSSEPLSVGAVEFTGYNGNTLVGQVDEVRLWNVARSYADLDIERPKVINQAPGLALVLHFDRTYPDELGVQYLRDSAGGGIASLVGAATLAPGGAPAARGTGLALLGLVSQFPQQSPYTYLGAVRVNGARDVVLRQRNSPLGGSLCDLALVTVNPAGGLLGTCSLPVDGLYSQLAARDSLVFLIKSVPQFFNDPIPRLFSARATSGSGLVLYGDSLELAAGNRMRIDPANPGLLVAAGQRGWSPDVIVSLVDVSTPGSLRLLLETDLGPASSLGTVVDLARRGSYVYITFSDGNLRIYRYDSFVLNGQVFRTLNAVGTPMAVGGPCRVAVGGSRLFVANDTGSLLCYDLSSPAAPAFAGSNLLFETGWTEAEADGDKVVLSGPNGVHVVDATNPSVLTVVASYCPDMPALGPPRASVRDGFVGLAAGIAGHSTLALNSSLAVDARVPAVAVPLGVGPNPARGATWFALPAGLSPEARLEIFDVSGRRVRAWTELARFTPGSRLDWNGVDGRGVALPAGMYVARLADRDRVFRAHLTLLR